MLRRLEDIQAIDTLVLLDGCIHPAAQVEVALALAHELNHTFALDLGAQVVLAAVYGIGIVGQTGTDADGTYATLHLLQVAARDGHIIALPVLLDEGLTLGQLVQTLSIHQQDVGIADGRLVLLADVVVAILSVDVVVGIVVLLDTDTCTQVGERVLHTIGAGTVVHHLSAPHRIGGMIQHLPYAAAIGYRSVETRLASHILERYVETLLGLHAAVALMPHRHLGIGIGTGFVAGDESRRTGTVIAGFASLTPFAVHTVNVRTILHVVGIHHLLSHAVSIPAVE